LLIDLNAQGRAEILGVVGDEVLWCCPDTSRGLGATNVCCGKKAKNKRILTVGLVVAASKRRADDVEGRAKQDVGGLRFRFGSYGSTDAFEKTSVKGGSEGCAAGKACCLDA
jgi:hypothetical protein